MSKEGAIIICSLWADRNQDVVSTRKSCEACGGDVAVSESTLNAAIAKEDGGPIRFLCLADALVTQKEAIQATGIEVLPETLEEVRQLGVSVPETPEEINEALKEILENL